MHRALRSARKAQPRRAALSRWHWRRPSRSWAPAGVRHPIELFLRLETPRLHGAFHRFAQFFESRFPLSIGAFLAIGFKFLGGQIVGLDPVVVVFLEAQVQPGDVSRRIDSGHRIIVGARFVGFRPFSMHQAAVGVGVDIFSLGSPQRGDRGIRERWSRLRVALLDLPFDLVGSSPIVPARPPVRAEARAGEIRPGSREAARLKCLRRSAVMPCASHHRAS